MSKCIKCKKKEGIYQYTKDGKEIDGYVCEECSGSYFMCPDCGRLFPLESGDAGNGFCKDCDKEH